MAFLNDASIRLSFLWVVHCFIVSAPLVIDTLFLLSVILHSPDSLGSCCFVWGMQLFFVVSVATHGLTHPPFLLQIQLLSKGNFCLHLPLFLLWLLSNRQQVWMLNQLPHQVMIIHCSIAGVWKLIGSLSFNHKSLSWLGFGIAPYVTPFTIVVWKEQGFIPSTNRKPSVHNQMILSPVLLRARPAVSTECVSAESCFVWIEFTFHYG